MHNNGMCRVTWLIRASVALAAFTLFMEVAAAQNNCDQGIVQLQGNQTGHLTICSALAAQAPELTNRLRDVQGALVSQQAQLNELTRLVRDLNSVSGGLALKQQTELLRNVLARLGDSQKDTATAVGTKAAVLSDHFEQVSLQMTRVLANPRTSIRASTEIQGETGDALSRLDFDKVNDRLGAISQQLRAIDNKLDTLNDTSDDTLDRVTSIQKTQQEERKQALAAAAHQERLNGSTADIEGGALERLNALHLGFDNDDFSEAVRNGIMPAVKAYLDAGMSPLSYYGGSDCFVLNLPAFEGTENFPEILKEFLKHKVTLAGVNVKSRNNYFYTDSTESLQDQLFLTLATGGKGVIAIADGKALIAAGASPAHALRNAQTCKSGWHCREMIDYLASIGYKGGADRTSGQPLSGEALYKEKRFVEAMPLLERDAEAGNGQADGMLGSYFTLGLIRTPIDDRAAFQLFQKGAQLGDANSMVGLGSFYYSGLNWLDVDQAKAIALFRKAADKGNARAMTYLGFIYFAGTNVKDDDTIAASWFRKAAELGDTDGMTSMHDLIMSSGRTSFLLYVFRVADLFRMAVIKNDPQSYNKLGQIFQAGSNGVRANQTRAARFFAAAQNKTL